MRAPVQRCTYVHASEQLAHPFPLRSGDWGVLTACTSVLSRLACVDPSNVDAVTCYACRRMLAEQALERLKPLPTGGLLSREQVNGCRRVLLAWCRGPGLPTLADRWPPKCVSGSPHPSLQHWCRSKNTRKRFDTHPDRQCRP